MEFIKYYDLNDIEEELIKYCALLLYNYFGNGCLNNYADIDLEFELNKEKIEEYYPKARDIIYFDKKNNISELKYGVINDLKTANEIISNQRTLIKKLKKENRDIKLDYAKCGDCKHADKYIPNYARPWIVPQCNLGVKKISYDSNACEDFERMDWKDVKNK